MVEHNSIETMKFSRSYGQVRTNTEAVFIGLLAKLVRITFHVRSLWETVPFLCSDRQPPDEFAWPKLEQFPAMVINP